MTTSRIKAKRSLKNLLAVLSVILFLFIGTAIAQSTDPFEPTPMKTEAVKGRWVREKHVSHYYSFTAGPGVVKIMFNCVADEGSTIVGGELSDADGHLLPRMEGIARGDAKPSYINAVAMAEGTRIVSTYEIKRRQKLIVRFYTTITTPDTGGTYTIKVSGDGVSFDNADTSSNNNSPEKKEGNYAGADKTLSLPKKGKLRIVMDDGTVQEINLSRVREAAIKP